MKKILAILMLYPMGLWGACPTYIQSTTSNANTFTNTLAFGSNITAGSLIVVACNSQKVGNTILVSDNNGGIYSTATVAGTTGSGEIGVYYAPNHAAGATSVTCQDVTAGATWIQNSIHEYSGAATINPLDVFVTSTTLVAISTNTQNSGNATTTANNELMFSFGLGLGAPIAQTGNLREHFVNNQYQNTQDACLSLPQVYNSSFTIASIVTYSGATIEAAFLPPSSLGVPGSISFKGGGTGTVRFTGNGTGKAVFQ